MRVLIIKNYSTTNPWGQWIIQSFFANIHRHQPYAEIDICDAVGEQAIPDLASYDLVVLTGGTLDLTCPTIAPWAREVLHRIRKAVSQNGSTKLLGLCWGHQAAHLALGGTLGLTLEGPLVGVQEIQLTSKGSSFFGQPNLAVHKFHKRRVITPGSDFMPFAENNEITISESGKVLTFQSHPELTYQIAQALVDVDDGTYQNTSPNKLKSVAAPHDGEMIWKHIMEWATLP